MFLYPQFLAALGRLFRSRRSFRRRSVLFPQADGARIAAFGLRRRGNPKRTGSFRRSRSPFAVRAPRRNRNRSLTGFRPSPLFSRRAQRFDGGVAPYDAALPPLRPSSPFFSLFPFSRRLSDLSSFLPLPFLSFLAAANPDFRHNRLFPVFLCSLQEKIVVRVFFFIPFSATFG